ncbi:MAG: hypothetical protein QM820_01175 [Minicystis sp.]
MTSDSSPPIRAATHVAFDPFTPDRLAQIGATNVVRASDTLLIGPSRRDGAEHARLRKAWWGSEEEWDLLHSSAVQWEPPVVLWVSASPRDTLNLFRACSWLRDLGIPERDVLVLEFEPAPRRVPRREASDCADSVTDYPDEVLRERLATAQPLARARYDWAVDLWHAFVDPDLSRFARICTDAQTADPRLGPVWAWLSAFFPRRTAEGALLPSRFDGLLLRILSDEWRTAVKVFVDKSDEGEDLRHLSCCTGDLFVSARLDDWANHGLTPAVERAPGPRADVTMLSSVYRLTEHGQRIRDQGLAQLADAPPLPMAGTEAYSPASPWVVRDDGTLARL